jgi:superfamily II DNA or RNA helicase
MLSRHAAASRLKLAEGIEKSRGSNRMHPDRFISSCKSWDDFWDKAKGLLSEAEKGTAFERLVQLYLQTTPEYRTELQHVWLLREVPPDVRRRINLPVRDEGIDLIARTRRGEYWAIQVKFRSSDEPLNRKELGTFASLAFNTCNNIAFAVVAHTSTKPISKRHLMRNTVEIGLDRWQSTDWSLIVCNLKGKSVRPPPRKPRPDQLRAITAAKKHFVRNKEARGRLIMPCGTGKSLIAFWIAEALKAQTIVVAVPSLGLIRQSVADWTREFLAKGQKPDWICVCSDESVGHLERDEIVGEVYDLGLPTHTDPKEIARELRRASKTKIVFTTYQSSDQLAAAVRLAGVKFDLVIFDEAHRTVGARSNTFAALLRDRTFKTRYRLFMTATERTVNGDADVFSMDDNEEVYGKRFFTMTFKEAIALGIISDYKILTVAVSDRQVASLIAKNRLLNLHRNLSEAEARAVATGIALKRIYKKYDAKHAISFHASILAADRFRAQQDVFNCVHPRAENFHVSSHKSAGERKLLLDEFRQAPRALMTNARCLQEGIDVPAIDCVIFADPRQSVIDVIQAAGRAMRRSKGKKYGYIVVPIIVPDRMAFEEFAETTAFRTVVRIITALSVHDTRIVDELRAIHYGRISKGKIIKIDGKVPVGMRMSLARFADAVSTKLWENVARVNWRSFEEARGYVRTLGLKNAVEWFTYCRSGKRPSDIPTTPHSVYADAGWAGWGDWLGSGKRRPGDWRSFEAARAFVRTLELRGARDWKAYCRSGKRPSDIPKTPHSVYADAGWVSINDWLGHNDRPFEEARAFARTLGFKSIAKWRAYCDSGKKPNDIPKSADTVYADAGWTGWGDWLGYELPRRVEPRPFAKARAFVRKLKLKSGTEWKAYCRSGKKPKDIPATPEGVYAKAGWIGMSDWLGSGRYFRGNWRPFKEARAFVRSLGLRSQAEWFTYCRSGKKPLDIPTVPRDVYADDGWIDHVDWLGAGRRVGNWRPFNQARAFVRSLGLKNGHKWNAYCRSGKKPNDIPATPEIRYAAAGWNGMSDWLGTDIHRRGNSWRPFKEARRFARTLGLKSCNAWLREYARSGKKPNDIPSVPNKAYADHWVDWNDWLGTTAIRPRHHHRDVGTRTVSTGA